MPVMNCLCGYRYEWSVGEDVFALLKAHNDSAHADLNIPDAALRELAEAHARMTPWDGATKTLAEAPHVRPLTPALADDFLRFFDSEAFADNPIWATCYCMFPHCTAAEWNAEPERTWRQNRADKATLIRRGDAHGYLAYDREHVIGWCHAAARTALPMLATREQFAIDDDPSRIGSIVCFVIAAPYRRQGVARRLLDAACDGLRAQGFSVAEAYPHPGAESDAHAFFGPMQMYLDAGFSVYREGERSTIVRKAL
jgi:GNAT superfamily N-acetyltransferase